MNSILINNKKVSVNGNRTILDAASELQIEIPTMCYLNGYEHNTTCMICVVHELKTDKLIPACSVYAEDGMQIETDNEKVRNARKDTLDMLLTEHVGDCEATCQRVCPSHMNIPLMIRQIQEERFDDAIVTIRKCEALPAVFGRVCSSVYENGCIHKFYDTPISICRLKRFVADRDLSKELPYLPEVKEKSGKKTAVVGAGAAGLTAVYFLVLAGHECDIYDKYPKPGGMLKYGVPDEKLDKSVLDKEVKLILGMGAKFYGEKALGKDILFEELREKYDAIVLTLGTFEPELFSGSGIELTNKGVKVKKGSFETSIPGVFAGGSTIKKGRSAIRSASHGKAIAYTADQYLNNLPVTGEPQRFNSMLGRIRNDDLAEFIKEAEVYEQVEPGGGEVRGYTVEEAIREATRCFHCDCRKPNSCKLRNYCEEYSASQSRFKVGERNNLEKVIQHESVLYEPGKCIKCNICVQITKKAGEELGLTMINRGFEVRIATPFNEPLREGLKKVAGECIEACPTAALAWLNHEEE
ncbi:2Fe-2S iron-sulfur cluster-binding protein [Bacteroidota bacterium]